ncbi:MAG: hypothetical protein ACJ72G_03755 [Friedmanniella sp.]
MTYDDDLSLLRREALESDDPDVLRNLLALALAELDDRPDAEAVERMAQYWRHRDDDESGDRRS